jgi:hypothetical protein
MSPGAAGRSSGTVRWTPAVLAFTLALLTGGCFSEHTTGPSGGAVSFAADVQPILSGSCAFSNCHGTTSPNPPAKPMVLATGSAYDNIAGVSAAQLSTMQRIRAGEPDNSYLIHKLQGTHRSVGGSGSQMPLGGTLAQAQIDLIRRWVTEGARRN